MRAPALQSPLELGQSLLELGQSSLEPGQSLIQMVHVSLICFHQKEAGYEARYIQCVKLTVATSPMATENYPLATYFILPSAILGDQLP